MADVGGVGVVGTVSRDGLEVVFYPVVGRRDCYQPVIMDNGTDQRATAVDSVGPLILG